MNPNIERQIHQKEALECLEKAAFQLEALTPEGCRRKDMQDPNMSFLETLFVNDSFFLLLDFGT